MISSNHAELIKTSVNATSSRRPEIYRYTWRLGKLRFWCSWAALTKKKNTTARIHLNIRYNQHCLITERSSRDDDERELLLLSISEPEQGLVSFLLALLAHRHLYAGWCCRIFLPGKTSGAIGPSALGKEARDFSQGHNITVEDLKSLLSHYEEARTAGIRTEKGRALWDILGAFYFVGTVVSTIGKSMDFRPCYKKIVLIFPDINNWKSKIIGCINTKKDKNITDKQTVMQV